jgi:hypothetical protein
MWEFFKSPQRLKGRDREVIDAEKQGVDCG